MARNESEILRGRIIPRDAPDREDASSGPQPIEILARVAAQMGEPDRAIAALQKLLSIPGQGALPENAPRTPALLRLDPMSIRSERSAFPKTRGRGSAEINSLHERMLAYAV